MSDDRSRDATRRSGPGRGRRQGVRCRWVGQPIPGDEPGAAARGKGVDVGAWDVLVIRAGFLSPGPEAEEMGGHRTPGADIPAAERVEDRGIIATGTDT